MTKSISTILLNIVAIAAFLQNGSDAAEDPFKEALIPPNFLMEHREELKLTEKQITAIETISEESRNRLRDHSTHVEQAVRKLTGILKKSRIDEQSALTQLDLVLEAETPLKKLHLKTMIRIRNQLTANQIVHAKSLRSEYNEKSSPDRAALEKRLHGKVESVKTSVEELAQTGNPPFEVIEMMQKFPDLMQSGKTEKAEAVLDRALEFLKRKDGEP